MDWWLIALWIAAAIPALLLLLPVGVKILYDRDGLSYKLIVGFLKFKLAGKKSEDTLKPRLKKDAKTITRKAKAAVTEKEGGALSQFMPLLESVGKLLNNARKKLRVKRLDLALVMGGEDPCQLALNYGRAWAVVGNIMPFLERIFVIKKQDVQVLCDFNAQSTKVYLKLDVTMTLYRLLVILVKYGIPAYREYEKITNTDEGGAENE